MGDVVVETAFHLDENTPGQSRAMTEDEILDFRRQWGKLWIPISDEAMQHKIRNSKEVIPASPSVSEIGGSRVEGSKMGGSRMKNTGESKMIASGLPMKLPGQ